MIVKCDSSHLYCLKGHIAPLSLCTRIVVTGLFFLEVEGKGGKRSNPMIRTYYSSGQNRREGSQLAKEAGWLAGWLSHKAINKPKCPDSGGYVGVTLERGSPADPLWIP